jgi:hypothetical protein
MKQKKAKLNLGTTFLIATIGAIIPLIVNLFEVNGNFSEVDFQQYYLIAVAFISFFLSFQIVNKINVPKETESYYLSILGVHFIITVFFILLTTIGFFWFF